MIKINAIRQHFLSQADWVNKEKTVDRVIVGDAEKEVDKCLVTWMPGLEAVRTAVERGFRLLICHEPVFWDHRDAQPCALPGGKEKLRFIEENDLTILRNHDCWDRWPGVGIPWAWAAFLGLKDKPAQRSPDGYQHRYDIPPVSFQEFAQSVAARTATIGEPVVEVSGRLEQTVSKIGIGTGCGCNVFTYLEMDCDCCVICDDGISYWKHVQYARDQGLPTLCVNHATSEEPGMITMVDYINKNIPGLSAEHLPQGCRFQPLGVYREARFPH